MQEVKRSTNAPGKAELALWGAGAATAFFAACAGLGLRRRRKTSALGRRIRADAERLALLVEGLDVVIWEIELATCRFTYINQRSEAMLGYPRQYWLEGGLKFFLSILHPHDRKRVATTIQQCIKQGDNCDLEYRAITKDGNIKWLRELIRISPAGDGIYGLTIDTTQQHEVQEALAASERRFRSIFDQAAVGIVQVRPDGHAILANERFCAMLGYTQPEITGKHFKELTHPEDLPEDLRQADRLAAGEIPHYTLEKRFLRRDGSPVWTSLTCSAETTDKRPVESIVAIVQDISAQKQAEANLHQLTATLEQRVAERTAELQQAAQHLNRTEQRERQRVAADLHDELAQLLVAAQMKLASIEADDKSLVQRLAEAQDLLKRGLRFVRTLITTLSPAALTGRGLDRALQWLAERMQEDYDLTVHVEVDHRLKPVKDELQAVLFHAARELLVNAAKHAQTPEAWVQLWRDDNQLCMRVWDFGVGFPQAEALADSSDQHGFGLPHLRDRVRLAGGDLNIRSAPGQGTQVMLTMQL